MPIEIISAEDALKLGRMNKERSYPSPGKDSHRLKPFPQTRGDAGFSFGSDASIFTAGSCFARNIERSLRKMNYNIISSDANFYNPFPDKQPFQRFNKYTIHSILNEIEWALGERPMNSSDLMCPTKDGLYCDNQTAGDSLSAPLEEMVRFRESFNATFSRVADANVVMLTLGLVECWYDNHTEEYLNLFPGAVPIKKNPGRFSLRVLDYDEIYGALCRTHDVISKHNSNFKMLVTVSPVPLERTFRTQDVLVANCYSKSVQRAAIEKFIKKYPADYFPSYESVTLSDMSYAWGDHDFRHVRAEAVDRLMGQVLSQYTQATERQSAQNARGLIVSYLAAQDVHKASEILKSHILSFDLSLELMQISAEIDLRQGHIKKATETLRQLISRVNLEPTVAEDIIGDKFSSILQSANLLLEQCLRLKNKNISISQIEKSRAENLVSRMIEKAPEDSELEWLKSYLLKNDMSEQPVSKENDKIMLIEAAALARMRSLRIQETQEAEIIVMEAIKKIEVSEKLFLELALMLRKADDLEKSLDYFSKVVLIGGSKSVQAVKYALPLARRLKKHDLAADLAEKALKNM